LTSGYSYGFGQPYCTSTDRQHRGRSNVKKRNEKRKISFLKVAEYLYFIKEYNFCKLLRVKHILLSCVLTTLFLSILISIHIINDIPFKGKKIVLINALNNMTIVACLIDISYKLKKK